MIAFFAQPAYSGALPAYPEPANPPARAAVRRRNSALHQLGIEVFGIVVVMV